MNRLLLEYISKLLHEYTDAEKRQIGIPPNAEARGRWWYVGDTYAGRVEGGRFIPAGFDGVEPPGSEDKKEKPATSRRTSPELRKDVPVSQEVSSADYLAVQGVFPEVREISVIDEIDHDTIQQIIDKLGIELGDTSLSPGMQSLEEGYEDRTLDGEYSDGAYYKRMRESGLSVREPLYQVPYYIREVLLSSGFPTQYIQLIERSLNTERRGDEPKFTDMIPGVGAGQNQSQFGEIMSMAMIALPTNLREEFTSKLTDIIGTESQQKKGLMRPVATRSWITSAVGHAESFDTHMNELYGEDMWRLEACAWDRKTDIEAIGLEYKNKGFSTDVILRVQPLNEGGSLKGLAKAQRTSLKKDENVMLFNGGIGEIKTLIRQGYLTEKETTVYNILSKISLMFNSKISEERERGVRMMNQLYGQNFTVSNAKKKVIAVRNKLDNKARENLPERIRDVLDRVENFSDTQKNSSVQMMASVFEDQSIIDTDEDNLKSAINREFGSPVDRNFAKKCWTTLVSCKKDNVGVSDLESCMKKKMGMSASDRVSKMGTFIGKVATQLDSNKYSESINNHLNLAVELGNDYLSLFSTEYPEILGGLMGVLAEKFPLNVVMSGTEFMIINGVHIGSDTMKSMFSVESYEEINLGLKILLINGEPMLVYQAQGGEDPVPIGTVVARQRGRGYSSIAFEIKCADEFVLRAADANKENGHSSKSNDEALDRIGKRLITRRAGRNR
jgi:hypothetical protein